VALNPEDKEAIERLHRLDVEATLSGKAEDLTKLWDESAVRLLPDLPAETGRSTIYASDKREQEANPAASFLSYKPDIRDVQVVGDWAFEWGYFDGVYREVADKEPVILRGKLLRVLRRQNDGSWKFARVMVNMAGKLS